MSNRSSALVLIAALGSCMLLSICGVLAVGGYFLLTNPNAIALPSFAAPAPVPSTPVNRIVFLGNDANIYVADPSSGKTTAITKDSGATQAYNYPTWSPDSTHLAFVGYTISNGTPTAGALYTVSSTGDKLTSVYKTTDNFPFYLYWSPDNQSVGFLANKTDQIIALRVARADQPDSMQELDTGSPFYWAWSPDGSEMFTHVGGTRADSNDARLALLPVKNTDSKQSLQALPGTFQAPQWSHDGKLLFSTQDGSSEAVEITNAQGADVKKLFTYSGRASFSFSPDGTQVASMVTDNNVRLPAYAIVHVIDTSSGNSKFVSQEPALAFLWSPDSKKLAFLTVTVGGQNQSNFEWRLPFPQIATTRPDKFAALAPTAQGGQQTVQLHWKVWDSVSGNTVDLAAFTPTTSFLDLIPYFDQYANSSTFWSPDSLSFVYTTRASDATGTVWIADATAKTAARKIGDGVIAFWSWR